MVKIPSIFVAFLENMNFTTNWKQNLFLKKNLRLQISHPLPPRFSDLPTALTEEEEWDFQYSDHTSVSPTGIFCASNDDDAWKPHEFYELISPHTQEDLLGLCCRTEQNCFTRLIIIVKSLKIFFNELNQEEGRTDGWTDDRLFLKLFM